MPSYGGFYVAPDDWADWLRTHTTVPPPHGAADAEIEVEEALEIKKSAKYLKVTMVPIPPSLSQEPKQYRALMIYRQSSEERRYLSPRSKVDSNGPAVLERLIGLKVSEWRTIWYNEHSTVSPYEAEFLKPEDLEDKSQASGGRSGSKKGTKRKRITLVDQSGESSSSSSPKVGGERNEDQPTCKNQL